MYTKKDYKAPYSLKLEWMMPGDDNSGVFVGFPDKGTGTDQTAITDGEEIQVDPTDDPAHTTGSIYGKQAADTAARDAALKPAGQWNAYEIQVRADRITVFLNGVKINDWVDPDKALGLGRIGLQMHGSGDDVYFRNVRVGALNTSVDAGHDGRRQRPGDAEPQARRAGLVRDVHAQPRQDVRDQRGRRSDQHGG